ncbi:hypothetical protein O6P37_05365 [Mycobacterium sp. CPCC 205372]|uniref:Lipoprotein n=1 Tax=Mycobacterium hippophais TaxID=3016340 RepID=A0ABT4PP11_9MYCO|nr:hypothetical protein [Mycobacterium hippophais]MCZ8378286.1 hypothetical protein [Mycobacterium hippophais]
MKVITTVWIACALLLTSCTPDEQGRSVAASPPAGWPPELNELTFVWDAEKDIDLTAGAAVVARAYTESYYLAYLTGNQKYLYPGFSESVDAENRQLWPASDKTRTWVGTARHHIIGITRADRNVTATACAYLYGTGEFVAEGAGYAANVGGNPEASTGIYPLRISLRAPEDAGEPLPPQAGTGRTPQEDVFDGWRVTGFQFEYLAKPSRWEGYARDLQVCRDAGDKVTNRSFTPMGRYPRSDFPTLPAAPGWPLPADRS